MALEPRDVTKLERIAALARAATRDDGEWVADGERQWIEATAVRPGRRVRGLLLAFAATAAAVAIAIVSWWRQPIRCRVDGAVIEDGAYVRAPVGGPPVAVRFSEGSELDLDPGG